MPPPTFITIPEGSHTKLSDFTKASPIFTADIDGTYVLQLIVDDGRVSSKSDTVTIIAETLNSIPVANAGPDQHLTLTSSTVHVELDGSASTDADSDRLSYLWSFVSTPKESQAELFNPTRVSPEFIADIAGSYVLSLIVNDGIASSAEDRLSIFVCWWIIKF